MAFDKLVDSAQLDSDLEDIADAIRAKTGGSAQLAFPSDFITEIGRISSGGTTPTGTKQINITQNGTTTEDVAAYANAEITVNVSGGSPAPVEEKDVIFIDYDGTIVYSYTASEFLALSALPANPSHAGLTAEGWNWTLSDAKSYVTDCGSLVIGQTYVPSNGRTKIYYSVDSSASSGQQACLYFATSVLGGVTIYWGDGTSTVSDSTTNKLYYHTYSSPGEYIIELEVTSGNIIFNFSGTAYCMLGSLDVTNYYNIIGVEKIHFGNNVILSGKACYILWNLKIVTFPTGITISVTPGTYTQTGISIFYQCYKLSCFIIPNGITEIPRYFAYYCSGNEYISFPNGLTKIEAYAFYTNRANKRINLPKTLTAIGTDTFNSSWRVQGKIVIPEGIIGIGDYEFSACYCVSEIVISSTVTSISKSAFSNAGNCKKIHFKSISPPAIANSNAFSNLSTACIIYVPAGSLSAYTSATNYPSSSTYTYVEE